MVPRDHTRSVFFGRGPVDVGLGQALADGEGSMPAADALGGAYVSHPWSWWSRSTGRTTCCWISLLLGISSRAFKQYTRCSVRASIRIRMLKLNVY